MHMRRKEWTRLAFRVLWLRFTSIGASGSVNLLVQRKRGNLAPYPALDVGAWFNRSFWEIMAEVRARQIKIPEVAYSNHTIFFI